MSKSDDDARPNIFPVFRYADARGAIAWLGRTFGFEEHLVVPGEGEAVAHAQLRLGAGLIMLGSAPAKPALDGAGEPARQAVYVHVADVDGHHARARQAGAEILREPGETEYGSREYTARDPEGNVWSFGTYQPLSSDE